MAFEALVFVTGLILPSETCMYVNRKKGSSERSYIYIWIFVPLTVEVVGVVVVFLGFRDKPRMYYSRAGLLYRPILTFQVRPLDASTPADVSRTPVAEVGTLWARK
jgi:hypothetical protein